MQLAHFRQPKTRASSLTGAPPRDRNEEGDLESQRVLEERDQEGDTFCATLEDLDKERDDVGVALQMLKTRADFLIGIRWRMMDDGWRMTDAR